MAPRQPGIVRIGASTLKKNLRRKHNLRSGFGMFGDPRAHDLLGAAAVVDVGGVDKVSTQFYKLIQNGVSFLLVGTSSVGTKVHGTKADG